MSQFDINHKKIVLKNKTRRPVIKNKTILPASEKPLFDDQYSSHIDFFLCE